MALRLNLRIQWAICSIMFHWVRHYYGLCLFVHRVIIDQILIHNRLQHGYILPSSEVSRGLQLSPTRHMLFIMHLVLVLRCVSSKSTQLLIIQQNYFMDDEKEIYYNYYQNTRPFNHDIVFKTYAMLSGWWRYKIQIRNSYSSIHCDRQTRYNIARSTMSRP